VLVDISSKITLSSKVFCSGDRAKEKSINQFWWFLWNGRKSTKKLFQYRLKKKKLIYCKMGKKYFSIIW
jgi:hypothetical protein